MKKTGILIVLICLSISLWAQEKKDTIRIKAGGNEIVIIKDDKNAEEEADAMSELKNGKLEFKQNIAMLQDSISDIKEKMKEIEDNPELKEKLENKIKDYEKQIAAMEEGIASINDEIASIREDGEQDDDEEEEGEEQKEDDNGDEDFQFDDDIIDWPSSSADDFDGHWAGVDLGFNTFVNSNYGLDLPEGSKYMQLDVTKSITFAINIFEYNIPFGTDKAGLTTGLGFKWNTYYFDNNISLTTVDGDISADTTGLDYSKNKLNLTYLTVPLLMEFQIPVGNEGKRFYFGGGVVGSLNLTAKTKQHYRENGKDIELYAKDDFNVSPFRYDFRVNMGFEFVRLFATYSPMGLFKEDKGPLVYPASIGLKILNF